MIVNISEIDYFWTNSETVPFSGLLWLIFCIIKECKIASSSNLVSFVTVSFYAEKLTSKTQEKMRLPNKNL